VNADSEKEAVTAFFTHAAQQPVAARNFLETRKVDYVFYGPREQQLGAWVDLTGVVTVYSQTGVTIYQVTGP
jgi:uncharacterized membrane protein